MHARGCDILHGLQGLAGLIVVLLPVEGGCKVVLTRHRQAVLHHSPAIIYLRILEIPFAELAVALAHLLPVHLRRQGQCAQHQQYAYKSSHQNILLFQRLLPISISITSSTRATAKKYIYCSSYSSNTTELKVSASRRLRSLMIGFRPNSSLPACT